jgi:hypothetical protein
MAFEIVRLGGFGIAGGLGTRAYGGWKEYEIFTPIIPPEGGDERGVEIRAVTGQLLGYIPTNVQQTALHKTIWKTSTIGSDFADFHLLEFPRFPISAYSRFTIYKFGKSAYTGYLVQPPAFGTRTKEGAYEFKTLGLYHRVKNFPIILKRYLINNITVSGSTVRYVFSQNLDNSVVTGMRMISSKTDSSNNNQNAIIQEIGTNWVEIHNVAGISQAFAKGEAKILPLEWSFIHRIDQVWAHLVQTWGNVNLGTQATFNPDKIQESTGYNTGDWIDLDGKTIEQARKFLQSLCQSTPNDPVYELGVDADGHWFCKKVGPEVPPNNVIYEGIEINNPELGQDMTKIINAITVSREVGENEQWDSGWREIVSAQDEASQFEYGLSPAPTELQTVPAFISEETAEIYANAIIEAYSQPRAYLNVTDVVLSNFLYEIGLWKYITKPDIYSIRFSNFDNIPEWDNPDSIDIAVVNTVFAQGPGCYRLIVDSSDNGKSITKTVSQFLNQKELLQFQLRCTQPGSLIRLEVRDGATWYPFDALTEQINVFETQAWDLTLSDTINLTKIDEIRFTVQNISEPTTIFIDQLVYFGIGSSHYTFPFRSAEFEESQGRTIARKIEFGTQYLRSSEKLASIKNMIDRTRLLSKVR